MNTGNLRPGKWGVPPPDWRYSPTQPNHHRVQPAMPANTQSVSRTEIEHLWDSITNQTPEPHAGIFGPSSISWKVNRESALFLGAGRASFLQLAHPSVAPPPPPPTPTTKQKETPPPAPPAIPRVRPTTPIKSTRSSGSTPPC